MSKKVYKLGNNINQNYQDIKMVNIESATCWSDSMNFTILIKYKNYKRNEFKVSYTSFWWHGQALRWGTPYPLSTVQIPVPTVRKFWGFLNVTKNKLTKICVQFFLNWPYNSPNIYMDQRSRYFLIKHQKTSGLQFSNQVVRQYLLPKCPWLIRVPQFWFNHWLYLLNNNFLI